MNNRKLATASTIGTFLVASLTGLLLFFEIATGSIRATHEWISILFLLAVLFHVYIHKKIFLKYFQGKDIVPVLVGLFLGASLFIAAYNDIYAAGAIFDSVIDSELKEVVFLFDVNINDAVMVLEAEGVEVKNSSQTISDLANDNKLDVYDVIDPLLNISRK